MFPRLPGDLQSNFHIFHRRGAARIYTVAPMSRRLPLTVLAAMLLSAAASSSTGCTHREQLPAANPSSRAASARPLAQLQRDFVELRFGMFIHFGILTYTGSWSKPNLDITQFNPTGLDPGQWADAAVAAKMTYGVLTTKHHDGFALWPSAASDFNVGHIPWRNGKGDVVRAYVEAFRSRGLLPGLYYSIWDTTEGLGGLDGAAVPPVTTAELDYVEAQLTELLTH